MTTGWVPLAFDRLKGTRLRTTPGQRASPDRVDALVWAVTDLLDDGGADVEVCVW